MRAQKVLAKDFQFYFPDLDNILLVECHEDESITIRSTKNNVSDRRKVFFIRKLAAEGFIPDQYQWFSGATDGSNGALWIKDYSWLTRRPRVTPQSKAFMRRLLVASCVLWIAMMRVLLVSHENADGLQAETPHEAVMPGRLASQAQPVSPPLLIP